MPKRNSILMRYESDGRHGCRKCKRCGELLFAGTKRREMSGFTLIELIIITVVIAIASVALLGVFTGSIARSADPMLRVQAVAIAQGYLEEALLKAVTDPDGGETNSCEEGNADTDRRNYDDVWDYAGLCINDTDGAKDQFGVVMAQLDDYNVAMTVTAVNVNGAPLRQVVTTVTHDSQPINIVLVGYR